jgi:hypothetical protein
MFGKVFIPYLAFMLCKIIYFSYFIPNVPVMGGFKGARGARTQVALRWIILIESSIPILKFIRGLVQEGHSEFRLMYNNADLLCNILSMGVVLVHGF